MSGPNRTDDAIAAAVRAWRAVHRMRQQDLAEQVGMARNSLAALERGERRVTVDDARRLCLAMGVGLAELVDPETARELQIGPQRPETGQGAP